MTLKEIELFEDKISKLILGSKDGVNIDTIIEYLDYINKSVYSKEEVIPLLNKLISENKIRYDGDVYLPQN